MVSQGKKATEKTVEESSRAGEGGNKPATGINQEPTVNLVES